MATKRLFVTRKPYNPAAYVRGGATPAVAAQTQNLGFAAPGAPGSKLQVAPLSNPYTSLIANAQASLYTPQQLRNISNQQVGAQINTALGQSNASSKAEQAQYAALASRAAGLASALGSFGAQYGANDAAAFNQAANTIGQLGTGLTGAAASDWQSQQDASKAAVAQTLGGQGQVAGYDPSQLRSAAQFTSVTAPGTSLAQQALNAKSLGEFGAVADLAQVKTVSDNFIAQAQQALQQRAAERASIIAQRPELFQNALQAQRQDNLQTQNHIDDMVSASQTWLQNQRQLKDTETATAWNRTHLTPAQKASVAANQWSQTHMTPAQKASVEATKWQETHMTPAQKKQAALSQQTADRNFLLATEGISHTDLQGNPVGEYTRVTLPNGQTAVVPWSQAESAKEFGLTLQQRKAEDKAQAKQDAATLKINQTNADANLTRAKAAGLKPAPYDDQLSKQAGYLVDTNRKPIRNAKGGLIKYKTAKTSSSSGAFSTSLVSGVASDLHDWKTGYTGTANGVPQSDPASQRSYMDAVTAAVARGPNTAAWRNKAIQLVNAEYGTPLSIALKSAMAAKKQGLGATDSVKLLVQSMLDGTQAAPTDSFVQAFAKVYGMKPADIKAILSQVEQLMQSGQIPSSPNG